MKKIKKLEFVVLPLIILLTALCRLIPHPYNFTPVCAMALFGACYFHNKYYAYAVPLLSMWISDLILTNIVYAGYANHFIWFYDGAFTTYGSFLLIVFLGTVLLRKVTLLNLFCTSVLSSIIFFAVSNFGVWLFSSMLPYPHTFSGLLLCYAAGLPFFRNTLLGDFFYTFLLFGSYELFIKNAIIFFSPLSITKEVHVNNRINN